MASQTIPHQLEWAELLKTAVTKKGVLSKAYSVFHNYSIGNQMLAMRQCMMLEIDVAPINTFMGWKKLDRKVKKGSKAIKLCMPVTGKYTKEDEKTGEDVEHTYQRFIYRNNWFVMSQTSGEDFKNEIKIPNFDIKKALKTLKIKEIKFDIASGNTQGFARSKSIAVNPLAELPHKTRFHEIAHVVLGHTVEHKMEDTPNTPTDIKEVEAESVSYILCTMLKLKGAAQSRGYIQHWLKTENIPEKSAQKIFGAANQILKAGQVA